MGGTVVVGVRLCRCIKEWRDSATSTCDPVSEQQFSTIAEMSDTCEIQRSYTLIASVSLRMNGLDKVLPVGRAPNGVFGIAALY